MIFPEQIREETQRLCSSENINSLAAAAQRISEVYRSDKKNRTIGGWLDILVYAAARMPATFGAVSRAIELSLPCFTGEINSVADYGAGTGTGIIAAALLTEADDLHAYEQEPNMIKLGKRFCEITGLSVNWETCDLTKKFPERRTDLSLCCYCLNELPDTAREKSLAALAENSDRLIIVEPGTPHSFAQMKKTRAWLISHGFSIAAPCTHEGECAISEGDWCHFSERVQRSALHKRLKGGDAPYEDEKFCFIAAQRTSIASEKAKSRIIRKPIIQSGRITLTLCTESGIETRTVTKSNPHFKFARKAETGDSLPE